MRVLIGGSVWATVALPTIGLRPMVFSQCGMSETFALLPVRYRPVSILGCGPGPPLMERRRRRDSLAKLEAKGRAHLVVIAHEGRSGASQQQPEPRRTGTEHLARRLGGEGHGLAADVVAGATGERVPLLAAIRVPKQQARLPRGEVFREHRDNRCQVNLIKPDQRAGVC